MGTPFKTCALWNARTARESPPPNTPTPNPRTPTPTQVRSRLEGGDSEKKESHKRSRVPPTRKRPEGGNEPRELAFERGIEQERFERQEQRKEDQ